MAKAGAQIEITASSSRLAAGLSAAASRFGAFANTVGGRMRKMFSGKDGAWSTGKGAIANFGGDMIGRGIDALAGAAGEVRDFEDTLQRLGQSTHQNEAQMSALADSIRRTSDATGVSRNELAQAASVYFDKTSDVQGMTKALDVFARTAQASGAASSELVDVAAAMKDSMKMDSSEYEETFGALIAQGEAGKVTLKELAREAPSLMAMFSKFGTGKRGVLEMNAAFQVGAKAFGSASQAATGLEAMMGMLQARQSQLAAQGVKVFKQNKDGTVTLRGLSEIVDDIRKKNIDPRKWGKVFGENKEGRNFLETLLKFPDLYQEILAAGQKTGVVQEYAMARADSRAGRLELSINRMKGALADAFTPERIEAFTRAIESAAEKIGPLVDGVGKIADFTLGQAFGLGKSIRGLISGDGNMFREQLGASRMKRLGIAGFGTTDNMTRGEAALARNAAGWDSAVKRIMGAEKNERVSKESIRAAYIASRAQGGYEAVGEMTAGSSYLRNAGVTEAQAREAWVKEIAESNERGLAMLAEAIAGLKSSPPTVQIGDNQVARAAGKSTDVRRRTH